MKRSLSRLSLLTVLGFVSTLFVSDGFAEPAPDVEVREDSIVLKRIGPKRRFGGSPNGVLYSRADQPSKTVVIFIHPESDRRNDYIVSLWPRRDLRLLASPPATSRRTAT